MQIIDNPFALIDRRIDRLENLLIKIESKITPPPLIIDEQVTRKGLSIKWNCSVRTIDNYIDDGMPTLQHKKGGKVLISLVEATEWLKKRRMGK